MLRGEVVREVGVIRIDARVENRRSDSGPREALGV